MKILSWKTLVVVITSMHASPSKVITTSHTVIYNRSDIKVMEPTCLRTRLGVRLQRDFFTVFILFQRITFHNQRPKEYYQPCRISKMRSNFLARRRRRFFFMKIKI